MAEKKSVTRKTSRKRGSRGGRQAASSGVGGALFHSVMGHMILLSVFVLILILLDILFSANDLALFLLILGVELLLGFALILLYLAWQQRDLENKK